MRRLVLITVINSAAWLQLLLLVVHLKSVNALPQGPSTDPCEPPSPCGKGAECKSMGSIAICVCPNDDKGDPFVQCMKGADEAELAKPSPSALPPSPTSNINYVENTFETASVHQPRASPTSVTTTKPTTKPPGTISTQRVSLITSSTTTTPPPYTSTTTRSPYVHVFQSSERPPTSSTGHHGYSNGDNRPNSHSHGDDSIPPSHRIPIVSNSNGNAFPQHEYPPRPINGGGMSTSPSYSTYHGSSSSSNSGPIAGGSSYDIFNEKTVGPIASSDYGFTNSYPYRGSTSHVSGSQGAYDYDSRPIHGPSRPTPTMSYHHLNRFGNHGYHPSTLGFPDPITESSSSRFASSGAAGTTYDIYNYNPVRNDIAGASSDGGFSRITDPLGKYENCRMVNGIVVCADNTNPFPHNHHQYRDNYDQRHQYPNHHRGDSMGTDTTYRHGSHRDREEPPPYSSYYPNRYSSTQPMMTSDRPLFDYNYNNRQGYPQHGARYPIESEASTSYGHHSFLPKEQRVSTQSVLTISSSSTTSRNDNGHPMCQSMCGVNSVCRLVLDRPVCGCPEGHSGDPSVRCNPVYSERAQRKEGDSCERHVECKETEICAKNKCIDPCKNQAEIVEGNSSIKIDTQFKTSICGTNAECLVVGHTPVCKCTQGNFGNPYVACVP